MEAPKLPQAVGANGMAKQKRDRIGKFDPSVMSGISSIAVQAKKVEPTEDTYKIIINMMLQNAFGTIDEATRCFDFANNLNQQALAKKVGKVTAVGFDSGAFEAVLVVDVCEKPADASIPVKKAFTELEDFFTSAEILRNGVSGIPATWKAKIRNTTVVEGHFQTT